MHALVTGATGFIGHHVARTLLEGGHDVTCLVRSKSDRRGLEGARFVEGDLGDHASLERALDGVGEVYHLASLLKVPWKPEFRTLNIGGTGALARAAASMKSPPVFVVVSSLAAAGPSGSERAHTENDPPRPISIYGRMKLDCERAAAAFAGDMPMTIVRPPMVFGEGDRFGLTLFRTAARGVHLVPTCADYRFSLVHVADLSRAIVAAGTRGERLEARGGEDGPVGRGVYYVADDQGLSYADLGRLVARALGERSLRVLHFPSMVSGLFALASELWARFRDRPTIMHLDKWREATAGGFMCDSGKARSQLEFAPQALLSRLTQTVAWYRAEGWLA